MWIVLLLLLGLLSDAFEVYPSTDLEVQLTEPVMPIGFQVGQATLYPPKYDILAPFPLGTREIGADPLEAFGGIRNIPRADSSTYPSDLYYMAAVGWVSVPTAPGGQVSLQWNSSMVNWDLITGWAGSVGTTFQGWAIGDITVPTAQQYTLYCWSLSSVYIDNTIYVGDRYGAGMITNAVYLSAGLHTFYVPFSGGYSVSWGCALNPTITPFSLVTAGDETDAYPDLVSYQGTVRFVSPYLALSLFNGDSHNEVSGVTVSSNSPLVSIKQSTTPNIFPGQTTPVPFTVATTPLFKSCPSDTFTFNVTIDYTISGAPKSIHSSISSNCVQWPVNTSFGGFVYTFLDFDGSVQYSTAKPPAQPCTQFSRGCSIILSLHGAGVTSNKGWGSFYQYQQSAWVILPTNRRFYGFDWQGPGMKDALYALQYVAEHQPGVPSSISSLYQADPYRIIYTGHSMGGHGTWLLSSHYPDRALAVAPAAGWINFPLYVPYFTRNGYALTDPYLRQLVDFSIAHDSPDFYTPHFVGIPLLTRFGSDDDNVPPYHMRRMTSLVDQLSRNASWTLVSEVPGEGHWWYDVCDGPPMQQFFDAHATKTTLPTLPDNFTVVSMNPSTSESKGGLKILQFQTVSRGAYIRVSRQSNNHWYLSLLNVRRFSFVNFPTLSYPSSIQIGNTQLPLVKLPAHYFFNGVSWVVVQDNTWTATERNPETYGPMWQVIQGPLVIVYGTTGTPEDTLIRRNYALYLANTLYYRGKYQVSLLADSLVTDAHINSYNLVLVGGPATNLVAAKLEDVFPVTFVGRVPVIGGVVFDEKATGVAFLSRSIVNPRLIAVLEGTDNDGLKKAVMLLPISSGVTMPDYAVAGPNWGWAGTAGFLAAGYWDNNWSFTASSSFTTFNIY